MSISIVIPVLNEASGIVSCLTDLQSLRGAGTEVIVVDGGSQDDTFDLAFPLADHVLISQPGRGRQMNVGAAAAAGDILLFLHADTRLPDDALPAIEHAFRDGAGWGRFDVRIEGKPPMLRVVAKLMNLRSRISGIATGDQAIFVGREAFWKVGGYPDMPLMEDLALSDALAKIGRPACLRSKVRTSGRRWEQNGVWKTIFLMWYLRTAYRMGVAPSVLARRYNPPAPGR